ncbi:MAG: hypothetical protein JWO02_2858 [Solirubrobacterales bacterium]|nr:hypothetical protein [Solirubrobacterales bacterium]
MVVVDGVDVDFDFDFDGGVAAGVAPVLVRPGAVVLLPLVGGRAAGAGRDVGRPLPTPGEPVDTAAGEPLDGTTDGTLPSVLAGRVVVFDAEG